MAEISENLRAEYQRQAGTECWGEDSGVRGRAGAPLRRLPPARTSLSLAPASVPEPLPTGHTPPPTPPPKAESKDCMDWGMWASPKPRI